MDVIGRIVIKVKLTLLVTLGGSGVGKRQEGTTIRSLIKEFSISKATVYRYLSEVVI